VRVLVVDDNHASGDNLRETLLGWSLIPTLADSGAAALAAVAGAERAGQPFDLALVDASMPDTDGFSLVHRLRELGAPIAVVMMLTTASRRGGEANHRDLRIGAYLTKPIKKSDLADALAQALRPAFSDDQRPALPDDAARAPAPRPPLHLLLAEDNVINQKLMVRLLEKAGHSVTLVRTGRAALEAIAQTRFDMVLMDVQMPEMDGFEATAAIRARERAIGGHLPLVATTAHAMRGDRERCLEAGFDGYVSKPIQFEELFDTIDRLAAAPPEGARPPLGAATSAGGGQGEASSDGPPGGAAGLAAGFDERAALERTGGDRELLGELIGVFLSEMPKWMRELEGALGRGDAAELRRVAHTVKGAVDSCGASSAYDAAMLLERIGRSSDLAGAPAAYASLDREIDRVLIELGDYAARHRRGAAPGAAPAAIAAAASGGDGPA
jgi:CheY-like chemotaxis protein/HPt (histidine-containing phosphotransfer) domain-containing protein